MGKMGGRVVMFYDHSWAKFADYALREICALKNTVTHLPSVVTGTLTFARSSMTSFPSDLFFTMLFFDISSPNFVRGGEYCHNYGEKCHFIWTANKF